MGNDGGSIPKRVELVKEKKKKARPDQNALTIATWFFCALSKRPLREPIVSCRLGKLYNKDAVLEFLLNKSEYGDGDIICSHISSIKDVKALNLTANPSFKEPSTSTTAANFDLGMVSRFICPITMKEMNGRFKFIYLDTCGCVFSEQGLKEVPSTTCLKCSKEFKPENIITINPTAEELEKAKAALAEKKAAKAKEKKEKKKLKTVDAEKSVNNSTSTTKPTSPNNKTTEEKISSVAKENKRKLDVSSGSLSAAGPSKRIAIESPQISGNGSSSSVTATVNQKVKEHLVANSTKVKQSKAIQSIYSKKADTKVTESYLVRGTFNRYAS